MIAAAEPADAWSPRIDALGKACLSAGLGDAYEEADAKANRLRRWHRRLTLICVVSGTLALLLGIVQLTVGSLKPVSATGWTFAQMVSVVVELLTDFGWAPPWVEIVLVLVAAMGVVAGYFLQRRDSWLYWRYMAERFRSSSFQVMIQPGFWGTTVPAPADWHRALEVEDRSIRSMRNADEAAEREEVLRVPEPGICAAADLELTRRLACHYRKNRLEPQIRYLEHLIAQRGGNWLDNPVVQPIVFFSSVVAVAVHLAFESSAGSVHEAVTSTAHELFENASILLLLLSAAIPMLWTGFRTWRSANEYARNVSRSRAKAELLLAQSDWLEKELDAVHDPFQVFTALAISENLLRNELREWLRLMLDTEWYG